MFKFIHKIAVKNYKREVEELVNAFSSFNKEQLADLFIYSVWTRAGLQNQGHFKLPNGELNLSPRVDYSMLQPMENAVKTFKEKHFLTEAMALLIWVHTIRGIANIEMEDDLKKLWSLIMGTKEFWDKHLNEIHNKYKNKLDPAMTEKTLILIKKIFDNLPPEIYIDNRKFEANLYVLKGGGFKEVEIFSEFDENSKELLKFATKSIKEIDTFRIPLGFPLEFVATYPDVLLWWNKLTDEEQEKMFENLDENDLLDENQKIKLEYLSIIGQAYQNTGAKLECSYQLIN